MLGYITLGSNDLDRSLAFHDEVLGLLGAKRMMPTAGGWIYGSDRPAIGITRPYNGEAATAGNGNMAALTAPDRATVDAVHAKALELGGTCEGAPGERMPTFYGAYFRDLDGNKFCVFKFG
jgi:catechol 2,3-dioxygenase-like lactoylglutathione lyase family enzyme